MFELKRFTKKFNTDNEDDLKEYDAILSNPLCSIITEKGEKLRSETFDEGKLVAAEEHIIKIVTWEQKVIS